MNNNELHNNVITEQEAAIYIGMSHSYLIQARTQGLLNNRTPAPPFIRIGNRIRYRKVDLDKWLEEKLVYQVDPFAGE